MQFNTRTVKTDVLVIGGGAAGMRAAIEAKKNGVDVVLIDRHLVGQSGCSAISLAAFAAVIPPYVPGDSPDIHFQDTVVSGRFLNNQKIVETFAKEAAYRILQLEEFNIKFVKDSQGYVRFTIPGHRYPRSIYPTTDNSPPALTLVGQLKESVHKAGVEVYDFVFALRLLTSEKAVVGAVGLDLKKAQLVVFTAKANVLATGGAGQLYQPTNNPRSIDGNGYVLAYDAGADIMDMEMVQFYPTMCISPIRALLVPTPLFSYGMQLINSAGEAFMERYDPIHKDRSTRDVQVRAIVSEINAGRGVNGGVYVDLSKISPLILKNYFNFTRPLVNRGVDFHKDKLIISPTVHFFMGGIRVNELTQTSLEGLYAAGEVAGGLHGANRLGGNALTETQVFGAKAGEMAAARAASTNMPDIDNEQVIAEIAKLDNFIEVKNDSITSSSIREELRALMWTHVGIIRDEYGLQQAEDKIKLLSHKLTRIQARDLLELAQALEVANMLIAAEMIVKSALIRCETRGAHYRRDYPSEDNRHWLKNTVVHRSGDLMTVGSTDVLLTTIRPE